MQRVVVGEGAGRWTGWVHGEQASTGVVVCPPVGHEAMWTHRALRHLADDLTRDGAVALRLDYPGAGDSPGDEDGPQGLQACVQAIVDAAAVLRERSGARRIVLCGLRLGATLAALAAEAMARNGTGAQGLILLAPPVTGRAYLRELRALQRNWLQNVIPDIPVAPAEDGSCETLGYRLPPGAVRMLEGLRMDRGDKAPAARVLLLDAWPMPASPVAGLADHYRKLGAAVALHPFDEYPETMRSAESAAVPEQAWRVLRQWLAGGHAGNDAAGRAGSADIGAARRPGVAAPSGTVPNGAERTFFHDTRDGWRDRDIVERDVWFDTGRQYGVLCEPEGRGVPDMVVIFANTGGNHHVGDCRLFVTQSRVLARAGVAALRVDGSALGDSPLAARRMSIPAIYGEQPVRDLMAAVTWARARGYRTVVLAGVCSGAYLAWQAALAGAMVDGLLLVNLLKFRWDEDEDPAAELQSTRVYLAAARNPAQWLRLLRGELNPWPHALAITQRLWRRTVEAAGTVRRRGAAPARLGTADAAVPDAAAPLGSVSQTGDYARLGMAALRERGVRVDLVYGAGDIGLEEARRHFGPRLEDLAPAPSGSALALPPRVQAHIIDRLDHALFLPESRAQFAVHLARHLGSLYAEASARTASGSGGASLAA